METVIIAPGRGDRGKGRVRPVAEGESGLLRALQARERAPCERFVQAHYRGVYRFFLWLTNDADAAADLTQETFAAFWESTGRLSEGSRPPLDLKAWLYGIA